MVIDLAPVAPALPSAPAMLPSDEDLPLLQTGAVEGDEILSTSEIFTLTQGVIPPSLSWCKQAGLAPFQAPSPGATLAQRALGRTCTCVAPCACRAAIFRTANGRLVTWRDQVLPLHSECWTRAETCSNSALDGPIEDFLLGLADSIRRDPRRACLLAAKRLSAPRATLSPSLARALTVARTTIERELRGLSRATVHRLSHVNGQEVLWYWQKEQARLLDPFASPEHTQQIVSLPVDLMAITEEKPCSRPGCQGTMQMHEKHIRAVDEAALLIVRCASCGLEERLRL
jgi:hypothetical protein